MVRHTVLLTSAVVDRHYDFAAARNKCSRFRFNAYNCSPGKFSLLQECQTRLSRNHDHRQLWSQVLLSRRFRKSGPPSTLCVLRPRKTCPHPQCRRTKFFGVVSLHLCPKESLRVVQTLGSGSLEQTDQRLAKGVASLPIQQRRFQNYFEAA